jgi:hypothetical protein
MNLYLNTSDLCYLRPKQSEIRISKSQILLSHRGRCNHFVNRSHLSDELIILLKR